MFTTTNMCVSLPEDVEETLEQTREMNLYCHFARGLGETRYMAAESWSSLNKTLLEVLDSYNEVNATLNLVLFEDAMAHMWVEVLEPRGVCMGGYKQTNQKKVFLPVAVLSVKKINQLSRYFRICSPISQTVKSRQANLQAYDTGAWENRLWFASV